MVYNSFNDPTKLFFKTRGDKESKTNWFDKKKKKIKQEQQVSSPLKAIWSLPPFYTYVFFYLNSFPTQLWALPIQIWKKQYFYYLVSKKRFRFSICPLAIWIYALIGKFEWAVLASLLRAWVRFQKLRKAILILLC